MKTTPTAVFLLFLTLSFLMPTVTEAQEEECWACRICQDPETTIADREALSSINVLPVGMTHCEPYTCSEYITCEDTEEDREQLTELLSLLLDEDPAALRTFVVANKDAIEVIPERNLLIFRSGCMNRDLDLFLLTEGQLPLLEE